ncbi:MAG: hypothetical protein M1812_000413 [Candelaria pacifica]|nr:MAG: hypothetical protein M1812_000413 [Candelaria pacifica]
MLSNTILAALLTALATTGIVGATPLPQDLTPAVSGTEQTVTTLAGGVSGLVETETADLSPIVGGATTVVPALGKR